MLYKKMSVLLSLFAIISILSLTSCSQDPKQVIIGEWKGTSGDVMEFFKDGTISITSRGMVANGNYRFIDKDKIRFDLKGIFSLAGPVIAKVSFAGNKMTFVTNKEKEIYERSK